MMPQRKILHAGQLNAGENHAKLRPSDAIWLLGEALVPDDSVAPSPPTALEPTPPPKRLNGRLRISRGLRRRSRGRRPTGRDQAAAAPDRPTLRPTGRRPVRTHRHPHQQPARRAVQGAAGLAAGVIGVNAIPSLASQAIQRIDESESVLTMNSEPSAPTPSGRAVPAAARSSGETTRRPCAPGSSTATIGACSVASVAASGPSGESAIEPESKPGSCRRLARSLFSLFAAWFPGGATISLPCDGSFPARSSRTWCVTPSGSQFESSTKGWGIDHV